MPCLVSLKCCTGRCCLRWSTWRAIILIEPFVTFGRCLPYIRRKQVSHQIHTSPVSPLLIPAAITALPMRSPSRTTLQVTTLFLPPIPLCPVVTLVRLRNIRVRLCRTNSSAHAPMPWPYRSTFEPAKVTTVWGPPSTEEAVAAMQAAQSARVTVRYVFRAEDVGTGREWLVFPRYSDFRCARVRGFFSAITRFCSRRKVVLPCTGMALRLRCGSKL